MKILIVRANQGFPDSRVEKEIFSLSKEYDVELLGWNRTKENDSVVDEKVKIGNKDILFHHICILAPQGEGFAKIAVPMFKFWIAVKKYLSIYLKEYDCIHFCDFDTAALAFSYVHRQNKRVIYDIFDYYADAHNAPRPIKNIIRKRENYFIENSDGVLLCSEKRLEQIKPAIPKKYAIIYNTPSVEMGMTPITIPDESDDRRIKIVYVGVLSDERYLKEIADIVIHNPNYEMHVAGFGALEKYFCNLSENYDSIFFYGKISYTQALYLESKSSIMTALYDPRIPNHKYASPNKFFEALMLGKPLVMIKGTGMSEFINQYNIGELIDLEKSDFSSQFCEVLEKLQSKNIEKMSNSCKELYMNLFSWDMMENDLLKLYRSFE